MKVITIPAGLTVLLPSFNDGKDEERPVCPKGDQALAAHFTSTVWLHPLVASNSAFHLARGKVMFEAGARINWYSYPAAQLLHLPAGVC